MYSLLVILFFGVASTHARDPASFWNPVINGTISTHPSSNTVLRVGDYYYLAFFNDSYGNEAKTDIFVTRSRQLTNFDGAPQSLAVTSESTLTIRHCVIQEVEGSVYIYYTTYGLLRTPTVWVIKANDPSNPMGSWGPPKQLFPNGRNTYKFDYNVMKHNNQLYLIGTEKLNEDYYATGIYVRKMTSPIDAPSDGLLIRRANQAWECSAKADLLYSCDLNRPYVIYNKGVSYIAFAAKTGSSDSSLTYMRISSGQDPMNASNWKSAPGPVFSANGDEDVYYIQDASFTVSPDGTETWMMYHAAGKESRNWLRPRIEKLGWNVATGEPEFPSAHGFSSPQPVPSGQQ